MGKINCYAELVRKMANKEILPPDADSWTCVVEGCESPIKNTMQFRNHLMNTHHFSMGTALLICNLYNPDVSSERISGEMRTLRVQNGEI